jgi:hypothetical protein
MGDEAEKPEVSRKQFVGGVAGLISTLIAACAPRPEATPIPRDKQLENQVKDSLEKAEANCTLKRVFTSAGSGGAIDTRGNVPVFNLPVAGEGTKESLHKVGYLKKGLNVMPEFLLELENKSTGKTEYWDVLLFEYGENDYFDRFEFEAIPAWDMAKMKGAFQTMSESKIPAVLIDGRLAHFSLCGELTRQENPDLQ